MLTRFLANGFFISFVRFGILAVGQFRTMSIIICLAECRCDVIRYVLRLFFAFYREPTYATSTPHVRSPALLVPRLIYNMVELRSENFTPVIDVSIVRLNWRTIFEPLASHCVKIDAFHLLPRR